MPKPTSARMIMVSIDTSRVSPNHCVRPLPSVCFFDSRANVDGILSLDENVLDPAKLGDSCFLCKHQGPATEDDLQQQRLGRQVIRGPEASNERMREVWNVSMRKAKEELEREAAQLATHNPSQAAAREAREAAENSNIRQNGTARSQQAYFDEPAIQKPEKNVAANEDVLKGAWDAGARRAFHASGRGRLYDAYHARESQQASLTKQASEMQIRNTSSSMDYESATPITTAAGHATSFGITNGTPPSMEHPKRRRATNDTSSSAPDSRQNSLGIENATLTAATSGDRRTFEVSDTNERRRSGRHSSIQSRRHSRERSESSRERVPTNRVPDRSASRDSNRSSGRGRSNVAQLDPNETKDKAAAPSPSKKKKVG